jgi:CHAD domain-containing protein
MKLEEYRIIKQEPLSETFLRVVNEQIGLSVSICKKSSDNADITTHELRKISKRIRALYRLYRKAIGEASYQNGQAHNRDLSQLLARHRLSAVLIETIQTISLDKRLKTDPILLNELILEFQKSHKQLTLDLIKKQKLFHQILLLLKAEKERIKNMPLLPCEFNALADGLRRTYRRGRNTLDVAVKEPTAENLHNLRKSVKYLWNQMILLRPLWPPVMRLTIHQLDLLAEKLGFDHDLAELEKHLMEKNKIQYEQLLIYIGNRRKQIQKTIYPLALRIYAVTPRSMAKRLKTYEEIFRKKF